MKKTIILSLVLFVASIQVFCQPQMKKWVLPPNIIDFTGTIPTYTPLQLNFILNDFTSSNGAFDNNGNLLFFVIDEWVYHPNGTQMSPFLQNSKGAKVCVFKVPNECNKYFLIYSYIPLFGYSSLYYSIINTGNGNAYFESNKINIQFGTGDRAPDIAVGKNFATGKRYLYVTNETQIDKYVVSNSGISLTNNYPIPSPFEVGSSSGEMEISPDGTKMALVENNLGDRRIAVFNIGSNGDLTNPSYYGYGSSFFSGLEFSPLSDKLFISYSPNGIGYIDFTLSNNIITTVPLSGNFNYSNLELGFDGNIYMIKAGQLYKLNLSSLVISSLPISVANTSSLSGVPTLPIQIDGEDYENIIGESDLYIKDDINDIGLEPNTTSSNIWLGDIWNCRDNPNCGVMEPPLYKITGNNFLNARIYNKGCKTSIPSELHLYWTIGRTGELWTEHWLDPSLEPSNVSTNGDPLGGELTMNSPVIIPPIAPGGNVFLPPLPWTAPNPLLYSTSTPMLCFLARIISIDDPILNEASGAISVNVKNLNNIATINTNLIEINPLQGNSDNYSFVINNPTKREVYLDLTLSEKGNNESFFTKGNIKCSFKSQLGEEQITILETKLVDRVSNGYIIKNKGKIFRIKLPPKEENILNIKFSLTNKVSRSSSFVLSFEGEYSDGQESAQMFYQVNIKKVKRKCWLWRRK